MDIKLTDQIPEVSRKYILLDANIVVAYYVPSAGTDEKTTLRIQSIIDSARTNTTNFFFYIPNFCIAEVFSVMAKCALGRNKKLDARNYRSAKKDFRNDIHNSNLLYHYELSRYHVLAMDLIAPISHYFKAARKPRKGKDKKLSAIGTFDQLILAMGLHLAKIHGSENVVVVSNDERLIRVLKHAKEKTIVPATKEKIGLREAELFTGIEITKNSFPQYLYLKKATDRQLLGTLGVLPTVGKMNRKSFRYRAFKTAAATPPNTL